MPAGEGIEDFALLDSSLPPVPVGPNRRAFNDGGEINVLAAADRVMEQVRVWPRPELDGLRSREGGQARRRYDTAEAAGVRIDRALRAGHEAADQPDRQ